jgi:hypothetical protein
MLDDAVGTARFAVVVPEEAVTAAMRVPKQLRRRLLGIGVYVVNAEGAVWTMESNSPPDS